ncbi:glycosyltransferase family 2 protein [Ferroplasma acidiphilum]|jgi:glycosyltransferase involved in cell wall biosynthesis|uniref:Glycosyltransferase n=1 Tax=Ferroplasma acidiphilum TaxID=74969 RepID=A0A1V0N4B3_9ARCH|nr:glycosyltransferase family 2 protein [Ferroplasma acidiphilum]ARD84944.1 glycosyltransferase [Ferroplasma acidiphilum]MCL4349157.1 glycosyltransferase family 2 protein [Candidatus Thermoplasmatota archaeon]WMT53885.1 MAG: glycosyltransferase family 2 protein [Ferroplasma acidiphilum]
MEKSNNYISVIITAYNRRQYVLDALKSSTEQSLSRQLYEIIIVKNFKDTNIDAFAEEHNVINVYSENKTLSGKIIEAMGIARGNILCFLDDDDMFYREKLEYVFKKFNENKNLCYLHNNFTAIDRDGKPLAYYNRNPDFNMSSISIRRETINGDAFGKVSKSIDTLIYLYAKESGMELELDSRELTYYRVTDQSVTHSFTDFNSFMEFSYNSLNIILNSYIQMLPLFHSRETRGIIKHKISFTRIRLNIFGGNVARLKDYLVLLYTPALESRSYEIKVAIASLFMRKYSAGKLYKNEKMKQEVK